MVVEPFEFDEHGAQRRGRCRAAADAEGVLDGEAVGEAVAGGGVAADAFGERRRLGGRASFEEFLDSAVDEPQPGLELEDGLADDGEPEMAGFDQPGVDRPDGDLVDAGALDRQEREGVVGGERRRRTGVVAHRIPALGPVRVADEPAGQRMVRRE